MPIHLGLEGLTVPLLYFSGILAVIAAMFWKPIVGLYYLVPLIPIQTVRYRLNEWPLGSSVVAIVLLAVTAGLIRRGETCFPSTPWSKLLRVYCIFLTISYLIGSAYLGSFSIAWGDPRFMELRDYMMMPFLLCLTAACAKDKKQIAILIALMCLSGLALNRSFWNTVSGRDFSVYSDDLRDQGGMGYAGVNGLAAFEAQFAIFLLAMGISQIKMLFRIAYLSLSGFSAMCLMYSLSRGGYVAFAAGMVFLGLVKQRLLLVWIVVFAFVWTAVLPNAVTSRVTMTVDDSGELDHSADTRLTLWEDAMQIFDSNPIVGTGFNTYAYMHRVGNYGDTHNIFIKVMIETGVIGLALFLWLLARTFFAGYRLFRSSENFFSAIGLGLAGWVLCSAVANLFGDRWTFLQVNGFLWVLAGLVAAASRIENASRSAETDAGEMALAA
ncbi:MAG TPA: O-antigen ligase family protein [Bryobacteraceae bacterium]|jgi:putative inorganic carbon (HCO3(-)) transporter|nr:O-antigen ligase family protein [Bryobacteraceae bacterium]